MYFPDNKLRWGLLLEVGLKRTVAARCCVQTILMVTALSTLRYCLCFNLVATAYGLHYLICSMHLWARMQMRVRCGCSRTAAVGPLLYCFHISSSKGRDLGNRDSGRSFGCRELSYQSNRSGSLITQTYKHNTIYTRLTFR